MDQWPDEVARALYQEALTTLATVQVKSSLAEAIAQLKMIGAKLIMTAGRMHGDSPLAAETEDTVAREQAQILAGAAWILEMRGLQPELQAGLSLEAHCLVCRGSNTEPDCLRPAGRSTCPYLPPTIESAQVLPDQVP